MKIVALQAENIKKLVAVEIRPNGNLVEITGKNGQGKTSVLDAIWWAFGGVSNVQAAPIRKGQTEARIRLDLGEIIVTRKFKDNDGTIISSITVENAEGARFGSPQTMLDNLLGKLSFDPLAFARMNPRAQFDTLKMFVPGVDFNAIEDQNTLDYARRTDLNRRAKEATIAADRIAVRPDTPDELVDEVNLIGEMEAAGKHNAEIENRKARREDFKNQLTRKVDAVGVLKHQIEEAKKRLNELEAASEAAITEIEAMGKQLDSAPQLPAPIDTAIIRQHIANAKATNEQVQLQSAQKKLRKVAADLESEAKTLTQRMEARTADKMAAIADAKLPVEGISFGDGEIYLNGIQFVQASDAEQLRASIAIAIALNPTLKVIRVRDGSLLDEDSMKILAEMADAKDYQIWVERVDSSGKVGFVLENGYVKSPKEKVNGKA